MKPEQPQRINGNSLPKDIDGDLARITINIGGLHASCKPLLLDTVLGSCISACLYDPVSGIGGMNHFMLPEGADPENPTSARYGVNAMELLLIWRTSSPVPGRTSPR